MTGARVAIVTLGCGRNEVDSEQVGGALAAAGFEVTADAEAADCVLVNTCTFIEPARRESIDVVLDACDVGAPVIVIGCMAQRYGGELAAALPEAAAVVGFAGYAGLPQLIARTLGLDAVPAAGAGSSADGGHADARTQLPLAGGPAPGPAAPPTAAFPVRTSPRGPWAYLKIANGCDRVCTFCSIPSFRGRFSSRPLAAIEAEARWLAGQGARELVCVSENTTSWGKDLPGGRGGQVDLIRLFEGIEGLERVRLLYLQPAELTAPLLDAMTASPVVVGYYDLSLQHASGPVLRRMARSGDAERFADLIAAIRARDPHAVFRSSFITGFPGETEADVAILEAFLVEARLDWAGFFTFSPEDGTAAAALPDQVDAAEAGRRLQRLAAVQELVAEDCAERFVGRTLDVLVEGPADTGMVGRSYRESPDTDGEVRLPGAEIPIGRMVPVRITAAAGVDLVGVPVLGGGHG